MQAAVCKAAEAGAIPARDSISSGLSVDRHTPVFQTGIEGALPSCPSIFRDAKTGVGHDLTGLAAVVQLRLRVAFFFGLQTLIVKSRLLTGENTVRIRGNPPVSKKLMVNS